MYQKMKKAKEITSCSKKNFIKEQYVLNSDSEQCETEEESTKDVIIYKNVLKEIEKTLISIIAKNKKLKKAKDKKSPFYNENVPKISIFDYLLRIKKYTGIENTTLIIGLIYIDRLYTIKGITLNKYNIHKILFTSILIAIKYNEEHIYNNVFYSKVAGLSITELNYLERKFLEIINYKLFVTEVIFNEYNKYLSDNDI
jgi:hypothetical protein